MCRFVKLNEHRKDKETGKSNYAEIMVNVDTIRYVQDKGNQRHTYISFVDKTFMFVKESFKEINAIL